MFRVSVLSGPWVRGAVTTTSRRARVAFATLLGGLALLVAVVPGARSGSRSDPSDVEGPLDLSHAGIVQKDGRVKVSVRLRGTLPPLRELSRYPSRVGAEGERYLCLQVTSRRHGRRLFCPGGKVRHRRIAVGISSYGRQGWTTKRGELRARLARPNPRRLQVTLPLRQLGPGRIRWAVLSGWRANDCVRAEGARRHGKRSKRRRDEYLCVDRLPNTGFARSRLRPLQRVGCTVGRPLVRRSGPSRRRQIALSFDDGPSSYTNRVVDILDDAGAKGTFFVLGSQVPGKRSAMRRALAHGHELANHSFGHEAFPSAASMRATSNRIRAATGFTPCRFRPPGGSYNSGTVSAAAHLGMSTVLWDIDPWDWSLPGSGAIYSRVVSRAHPGAIVVLHDGGGPRGQTVAALPRIISTLKARGYRLVTVTKLLGERFRKAVVR